MRPATYLWYYEKNRNFEHITRKGYDTEFWEMIYERATQPFIDDDYPDRWAADAVYQKQRYRVIYTIENNCVTPIEIEPITIFPIVRKKR